MTEQQIADFGNGYWECRAVIMGRLKEILKKRFGLRSSIKKLFVELEIAEAEDHWKTIQKEQPGITREEYQFQLDEDMKLIREKFYTKDGYLKPRLVRN